MPQTHTSAGATPEPAAPFPSGPDDAVRPATRGPRRALVVAIAALVIAAAIGGWLLGTLSPRTGYPTELSADAGFARDMQTHHNQAVQLSLMLRDRSDNEAVRSIAYDIATTQSQQSGQMFAWLQVWGLPQTGTRPAMTWMEDMVVEGEGGHASHSADATTGPTSGLEASSGHSTASMGMASQEDIDRLEDSTGTAADRLFLGLMIRHHTGGVAMAEAAMDRAENPLVLDFAQKTITAQSAEITALNNLLADLG